MSSLDVYLHRDRVGLLERLQQSRLRFRYTDDWLEREGLTLSLCLPRRQDPFKDEECRPFFAGLLPEGDFLAAIARSFHISAGNPFSLLSEIGGECAGAVSLVETGQRPPFEASPNPKWLDDSDLADLIDKLPHRPLLAGEEDGIRLSLAGTQDKLPVLAHNGDIAITWGDPPSTHIIKTPIRDYVDTVTNEAFCMRLARELSLDVAEVAIRSAHDREFLFVRRYDRASSGKQVERIHQEDLCQALGIVPELKYEREGGPDVAACASVLDEFSGAPGADLIRLLRALLFNFLIGNHDAHSKNFSILYQSASPTLAPLYDLISTRVYEGLPRKLAMKYGGEYRPEYLRGRHLDRLAGAVMLRPDFVRTTATQMASEIGSVTAKAKASLPEPWRDRAVIGKITHLIEQRSKRLREAASEKA